MGNYYEGEQRYGLNKNISEELLRDFKLLASGVEDISLYSETIKKTEFMSHPRRFYPRWELHYLYRDISDGDIYSSPENEDSEGYVFIGYEVVVNYCMKGYYEDGNPIGELIFNYMKPLIDITFYLNIYKNTPTSPGGVMNLKKRYIGK